MSDSPTVSRTVWNKFFNNCTFRQRIPIACKQVLGRNTNSFIYLLNCWDVYVIVIQILIPWQCFVRNIHIFLAYHSQSEAFDVNKISLCTVLHFQIIINVQVTNLGLKLRLLPTIVNKPKPAYPAIAKCNQTNTSL